MIKTKITHTCSILMSILFATQHSLAENSRIEFEIGQSNYSGPDISTNVASEQTFQDNSDTSLAFTYGYQLYKHLALQASYYDFGQISTGIRLHYPPFDQGPDTTIGIETSGWSVAIVPQLPLSKKIRLFGELGLHEYTMDFRIESPNFVDGEFSSMDIQTFQTGSEELFYAIGLSWDLNQFIYFKLKHGQYVVESEVLNNATLGVGYRF